jgi:hypothetical protein
MAGSSAAGRRPSARYSLNKAEVSITNVITKSTTTISLQIGLQMGERSLGEMGAPLARLL